MDPFFEYLYFLAGISITFVGFASLYLTFRQVMARKSTKFDALVTQNHFVLSFLVVGASLLPPLLGLIPSLDPSIALRCASVVAALPLLAWCITYPRRRSGTMHESMPLGTKILLGFFYLVGALYLLNVLVPGKALYAFAATIQQFTNAFTFIYALGFVLNDDHKSKNKKKSVRPA